MKKKSTMTVISGTPGSIDLDQQIQRQLAIARECVIDGALDSPTCTIWTADRILVVPMHADNYEQKASIKKRLRKIINSLNVQAAIMTSLAWLRDPDDPDQRIMGEAIVIAARNVHEHLLMMQKFTRTSDGAVAFEPAELDIVDNKKVCDSWFTGCKFVA
jgi:hypothetical protein